MTKPNIIVFLTDDQTVESFGKMAYLNSRPNLIRFTNAWVNNALCCPSRATILSGRYDTHTMVLNNAVGYLFDPTETIGTWLQTAGYRTAMVGKYLNGIRDPMAVPPGWSDWQSVWPDRAGYRQYGYTMNVNGHQESFGFEPKDYAVSVLTKKAARFIAASASVSKPFMLYFAPTATHGPFVAGPDEVGMYHDAKVPTLPAFNEADVSDKPAYIRALPPQPATMMANQRRSQWEASVTVDHAYRQLDSQLQASGVADNTVVIFLSDNGYAFGDHRWKAKMCEYSACMRIPMVIRYPGLTPRTTDQLVSNVDIASTVADLAGVVPRTPQDGRSLLPLTNGAVSSWRTSVLHHWSGGDNVGGSAHGVPIPEFWAVRSQYQGQQWTYVELATGEKELYDLRKDPAEKGNVADDPAYKSVKTELHKRLLALRADALKVHLGVDDQLLPPRPRTLWIDEYQD